MKRKHLIFGILLFAIMALMSAHAIEPSSRPNIIFILVDDMGWGDLGAFYQNSRNFSTHRNQPELLTPKLDTLASAGMQLRRHYCSAPVCAPSRASLLLGVHQGHANVRDNQFDKSLENNHTLASVLKQAGYATAIFGKWGLQGTGNPPEAHPMHRGFDYFFGYMKHLNGHQHYPKENGQQVWDGYNQQAATNLDKCYTTDLWTARAKKWITNHQHDHSAQPFFIYLAFDTPHARLQVPSTAYPSGAGLKGGVQWTGKNGEMINTAKGEIDSWIHPDYTNQTWDNDNNPGTAEIPWPMAEKRHATMIRRLDDAIADLMQLLKDLDIDRKTFVVFTSDNGPHNEAGTHGTFAQDPTFFRSFGPMDGIKRDSWEAGIRVPTLACWPGHIPAGTTNWTASQFHDWMPTFAELASIPTPVRSDGVSLLPTLTGHGAQRPGTVYVEYNFPGKTPNYKQFETFRRGAIRGQEQILYLEGYKGIRYNIKSQADDFQIYDTLNDVKEKTNLATAGSRFTELQQRMKDCVLQLRNPQPDASRPYDDEFVPASQVTGLKTGLVNKVFNGTFPWVPHFHGFPPTQQGIKSIFELGKLPKNSGAYFQGYLKIPADGKYTFYLTTTGHGFLKIHHINVIDADFGYTSGTEVTGTVELKAGYHPIRLSLISRQNTPTLTVQWSGPNLLKQDIPESVLFHSDEVPN